MTEVAVVLLKVFASICAVSAFVAFYASTVREPRESDFEDKDDFKFAKIKHEESMALYARIILGALAGFVVTLIGSCGSILHWMRTTQ